MSRRTAQTDQTPARRAILGESRPPDFGRHSRKCCICRHPQRRPIEAAFLEWHSPDVIADKYGLPGRNPIYRHVHAAGLWARRKRNLRFVLDNLLERAGEATVTASAIVSAVYAYTHINDDGKWIEPPAPPGSPLVTHHSSLPSSNRDTEKVENDSTH